MHVFVKGEGCKKFNKLYNPIHQTRAEKLGLYENLGLIMIKMHNIFMEHLLAPRSYPTQSFPPQPSVHPPAPLTTLLFLKHLDLTKTGVLNVSFHS